MQANVTQGAPRDSRRRAFRGGNCADRHNLEPSTTRLPIRLPTEVDRWTAARLASLSGVFVGEKHAAAKILESCQTGSPPSLSWWPSTAARRCPFLPAI